MKYYIIAGEKSGDMHAAKLVRELRRQDTEADIRAWGGDEMAEAGAEIVRHYRETSFMGFLEVAVNLRKIRRFFKECKADILNFSPDVLILVDYPGFNLRMARFAHKKGIRTHYYISPKIWAWNTGRAKKVKAYVDRMFVILPFEKAFYDQFDYETDYVGNPLFDAVSEYEADPDFLKKNDLNESDEIVALLPGSRKQEVLKLLPAMIEVSRRFSGQTFVIAGVSSLPDSLYAEARAAGLRVVRNSTYDLLTHARAALVSSGTAALEAALLRTPQVVVYKVNAITALIARIVIKVPFVSLVNLITGRETVRELLQENCTPDKIGAELRELLSGERREKMLSEYEELFEMLETEGVSRKAAKLIYEDLNKHFAER